MWIEKYKPKNFNEFIGNSSVVKKLQSYHWKKPILLYGPHGCGKTTLVQLLSEKFEPFFVKNEDLPNLLNVSETQNLFGKKRLIVFDDVENIDDISKVTNFLKETNAPTVVITSDIGSKRLSTIKKICEKVQMRKPMSSSITALLEKICKSEGIYVEKNLLSKIAENSQGDIRAAVIDLEMVTKGKNRISDKDLSLLVQRDKITDIYSLLSKILIKKDIKEAIRSVYDVDQQPRDILLWIDENVPSFVFEKENLAKVYNYISKADIFIGRIQERQHWGFLGYANTLMSAGVNVSRGDKIHFARYRFPFYIIHMAQTKSERNLKKSIAEKLSKEIHDSEKAIIEKFLPLYKILIEKNKIKKEELMEHFNLTEEEIQFLMS
ncbi:MAG: AAA family ATPase [Candidatus Altiarchaeota archaeon]